jgi:hypothetical protein
MSVSLRALFRPFALAAAGALLAACGGGSSSGPAAPATALAPATTAEIAGFVPPGGAIGSTISINGSGLSAVTAARVGGVDANFRATSDTTLEITVPAAARSGRIELNLPGRVLTTTADYTVLTAPSVAAVTPTTVLPPARLTLTGAALDLVREVRLNALALPVVSRSSSSVVVDVPTGATSGTLTLLDAAGVARPLPQPITVAGALGVTSFAPATIVTGQTLTVTGTNLDRATGLVFANGATAPIAARSGATRITAIVPDAAGSGVFRVRGNLDDEALAQTPLAVVPAIRVDANAIYRVAAAGDRVTLTGTGLDQVAVVRVGGATPAIEAPRSATQLSFLAPPNLACGTITLESTTQPTVPGGGLVVGSGCVANLAGVEFAQVLSQAPNDARLRLVPNKETWVRAYVVATQPGVPAPQVRLTGYMNAVTPIGTLPMAGPATLPVVTGAQVPDSVRYDDTQSFNVEVPAAWVRSGFSVRVEVDPMRQLGAPVVLDVTPTVGQMTKMEIVVVPVVSGGFSPTVPSTAAVLDEITRRFPIPRANITVLTRAAYTLTSVTDGLDTSTEWSNALSELNQLRTMEAGGNATRFYFGFVRRSAGGIAGIGYVPGRSALGWDSATQWTRTMSHELGHNFGRLHAPCGGPASPDLNYPYANGALGPTPLTDSVPPAFDIVAPAGQADIMGYCNGSWFSDYNYREMQRYIEGQPSLVAQAAADAIEQDVLLVAGAIGLDGVGFAPVQALRAVPSPASGEYTLRLTTVDGRRFDTPVDAPLVDHALPPERQFAALVPNPGVALARLDLLRNGQALSQRLVAQAAGERASVARLRGIDWTEAGGVLTLRWDTAAATHVGVAWVDRGTRIVLGINASGGSARFDVSALPAGGRYEVTLSDGLNARTLQLAR